MTYNVGYIVGGILGILIGLCAGYEIWYSPKQKRDTNGRFVGKSLDKSYSQEQVEGAARLQYTDYLQK